MIKRPAYYIEKFMGLGIGLLAGCLSYKYWGFCSFICSTNFFDKVITISTTLFGFLLTVLTLIIQSTSPVILQMKQHGSYKRLILFNKNIVLLSATVCIISLILNSTSEKLLAESLNLLRILSLINFALFIWSIVDTFIFVFIFYRILTSETEL